MAIHTRSTLTLLSILLLVSTCTAALTLDLTSHFLNATQLRIMQANAAAHEDPMTSKLLRRQSTLSTAAVNRYNSYTATVSIGSPARGELLSWLLTWLASHVSSSLQPSDRHRQLKHLDQELYHFFDVRRHW